MPIYRIHFRNHGGHVFSTHHFDSDSDESARKVAFEMNVPGVGHGFELWRGDQFVCEHPLTERPLGPIKD